MEIEYIEKIDSDAEMDEGKKTSDKAHTSVQKEQPKTPIETKAPTTPVIEESGKPGYKGKPNA